MILIGMIILLMKNMMEKYARHADPIVFKEDNIGTEDRIWTSICYGDGKFVAIEYRSNIFASFKMRFIHITSNDIARWNNKSDLNKCSSGLCCTKIDNLCVNKGNQEILKNVNLHVHCGELSA